MKEAFTLLCMRSEKHQPPPDDCPNQICILCGSSPNMTAFCHGNHTRCRLLSAPKLADAQSQIPGVSHHHNKVVVTIDGHAHASVIIHKVLLGHLQGVIPASNHVQRPQKACQAKRRAPVTFPSLSYGLSKLSKKVLKT